jgi:hypothetical protein
MIRDTAFADIVTGNDPEGAEARTRGPRRGHVAEERAQLRRLIELYVGRVTPPAAKDALARLDRAGFDNVRFAWAAASSRPAALLPHSRPTLLIEYDDTQNDANHIHTVYRDLDRDFGGDALARALSSSRTSIASIGNTEWPRARAWLDSPHRFEE